MITRDDFFPQQTLKTEKVHIEACLDLFESSQKHVTVGIFKSHLHKKLIYEMSSIKVLRKFDKKNVQCMP